jgi:NAD-dependent SIR2 family protein deacetylase
MMEAQGYVITEDGTPILPNGVTAKMTVPSELIPHCPKCGRPMIYNLRSDNTFVEDEGWHVAANRYSSFLHSHQNTNTLFLELAVGYNTPGIVKYPFWRLTHAWQHATYACLNYSEAYAPDEIIDKSICINDDIGEILDKL